MAASKADIAGWLRSGKRSGATHVVVVCDEFDHDDYPVYVKPGKAASEVVAEYNAKAMQRVMEVYDLSLDLADQLNEHRAWHV